MRPQNQGRIFCEKGEGEVYFLAKMDRCEKWAISFSFFFFKAPLTRPESDLSAKEANERLLNELTLGDIYPNALGKERRKKCMFYGQFDCKEGCQSPQN